MARQRQKIIVALSGGVDSAVAALCLLRDGHEVEALHMTNWEDDPEYCSAARDYQDARAVSAELGIPLHRVNFSQTYREQVFAHFLAEYEAGRTPNPDILCNREIKFGVFLAHARRLGAERIATGHYARRAGEMPARLLRGRDPGKDQSYFLHAVPGTALAAAEFPLGEMNKTTVREMANAAGLPVHAKRDSTGICFIGERPFREFLARYLRGQSGPMQTPEGRILGQHAGLMHYTPGQRRGLGIGGQSDGPDDAWYVAAKDTPGNRLIVVQGREHPLLWSTALTARAASWINGPPAGLLEGREIALTARIRYRQPDTSCRLRRVAGDLLELQFDLPQWAVAPGQSVVFYAGDECLGGAVIEQAGRSAAGATRVAASA